MEGGYLSNEVYNHGMALDPQNSRVQCNYCGEVLTGFDHLRHHLIGTAGKTAPCKSAPGYLKRQFSRGNLSEATSADNNSNGVGQLFDVGSTSETKGLKRAKVESAHPFGTRDADCCLPRMTYSLADNHSVQSSSKRSSPDVVCCLPRMTDPPANNHNLQLSSKRSSPDADCCLQRTIDSPANNHNVQPSSKRCFPDVDCCFPRSTDSPANNHNVQSSSKSSPVGGEVHESSSLLTKKWIGKFFFENGIDFGCVDSPSFRKMMEISANARDIRTCIPTAEELEGLLLSDEHKEVQTYVEDIKASWPRTGCSIILDGWVNDRGRDLLNILVDCPLGPIYLRSYDISNWVESVDQMVLMLEDVIAQVGAQNVVQVISHATSRCLDAVGEQLVAKYRSLFWTVSATYCISVMLEKIGMIDSVKLILDKAKCITRFIYSQEAALELMKTHISSLDLLKFSNIKAPMPFLTLENILMERKNLENMVTSSAWLQSPWASKAEAKGVTHLVLDKYFWAELTLVVRATIPLVRVLSLINEYGKPHTGVIYETMDQVKETICEELGRKKSQYMPFWKIIDQVWNEVLHSPLHAAGYFLNPSFHYSEDFCADPEVTGGLLTTVVKMAEDLCTQDMVTLQLDAYGACKGAFKKGTEKKKHETIPPAAWWSSFGSHCPDLQKLAIKILSQTCSGAESYGIKRDMAEKLLSRGRSPLELQKQTNLLYVHYNMHLKQTKTGKSNVQLKDDNLMVDWIMNQGHPLRDVRPQKE